MSAYFVVKIFPNTFNTNVTILTLYRNSWFRIFLVTEGEIFVSQWDEEFN